MNAASLSLKSRERSLGSKSIPAIMTSISAPSRRHEPVADGSLGETPSWDELLEVDRQRVWHPYGPMPAPAQMLPVVSAAGVRLRLADGRELVDAMSSWWSAIHGYRHPVLDQAVTDQLGRMAHVMFGGLTHEPAIRLADRLVGMTPAGLDHVFFADSGSVAVEVAIKMALQAAR